MQINKKFRVVYQFTHRQHIHNLHKMTMKGTNHPSSNYNIPSSVQNVSQKAYTSNESLDTSMVYEHATELSTKVISSVNELEKLKTSFHSEIEGVLRLSREKDQLATAFGRLCIMVVSCNEKMISIQKDLKQDMLKILALQCDQEVNKQRKDATIKENSDKIQSIEVVSSCRKDLCKVYITFTSEKEVADLRSNKNLFKESRKILESMEIDLDQFGISPMSSVNFQHMKVKNTLILTLCITFSNEIIASYVRNSITRFNCRLEEAGKLDEMLYCEHQYWSKNVWQLLRTCWELKRLKLINSVHVRRDGIFTRFSKRNELNQEVDTAAYITNYSDINNIRKLTNDIHKQICCSLIYDTRYFSLNFEDRDRMRRIEQKNIEDSQQSDRQNKSSSRITAN